jgi:hypothetical protein
MRRGVEAQCSPYRAAKHGKYPTSPSKRPDSFWHEWGVRAGNSGPAGRKEIRTKRAWLNEAVHGKPGPVQFHAD